MIKEIFPQVVSLIHFWPESRNLIDIVWVYMEFNSKETFRHSKFNPIKINFSATSVTFRTSMTPSGFERDKWRLEQVTRAYKINTAILNPGQQNWKLNSGMSVEDFEKYLYPKNSKMSVPALIQMAIERNYSREDFYCLNGPREKAYLALHPRTWDQILCTYRRMLVSIRPPIQGVCDPE